MCINKASNQKQPQTRKMRSILLIMCEICPLRAQSTCLDVRSVSGMNRASAGEPGSQALPLGTAMAATTLWHHLNDTLETSKSSTMDFTLSGDRKFKEMICEYHDIRDNYWADVIAGSKRDLKNALVLLMSLPYTLCLGMVLMYQYSIKDSRCLIL